MKTYKSIILEEANYGGLPVMYLPLDEATGTTAADLMTLARGTGYAGTYAGGYTLGSLGPISGEASRAVTFDGSSGYIDCGNLGLSSTGGTLEAWFRITTLPSVDPEYHVVAAVGIDNDAQAQQIYIGYTRQGASTYPLFVVRTGNPGVTNWLHRGGSALAAGNWYHLSLSHANGSAPVLALNSSAESLTSLGTADLATNKWWNAFSGGTQKTTISARPFSASRLFALGLIANVAVYSYALSAARIQAHYLAGINGCNGLRISA